jgi:hypothetical protein
MPRLATNGALRAAAIGLLAAVALTLGTPAAPAAAADPCCSAALNGVPAQITAGGAAQQFNATIRYQAADAQHPFRSLGAQFTLQGQSLSGSQIQLQRSRDGGWRTLRFSRRNGLLVATDTFDLSSHGGNPPTGGQINLTYQIRFGSRTASQNTSLRMTVVGSTGHGSQQLAGTGSYPMAVLGAAPTQTQTTPPPAATPSPTPASTPASTPSQVAAPTAPAAGAVNPSPGSDASSGGGTSGVAWIAYIVGGLLLLGGIGAIGTMLWRRGQNQAAPEWDPVLDGPPPAGYGPAPGTYVAPAPTTYGSPPYADPAPTAMYPTTGAGPDYPPTATYPAHPAVNPPTQPMRPYHDPTERMPRQ